MDYLGLTLGPILINVADRILEGFIPRNLSCTLSLYLLACVMKSSLPLTEQDLTEFVTALEETSKDFQALRERYIEVRDAFSKRTQAQAKLTQGHLPKAELNRLKKQIETLEETLENQLMSWNNLKEPFWQVLRFMGLGMVLGWLLRGWFGG